MQAHTLPTPSAKTHTLNTLKTLVPLRQERPLLPQHVLQRRRPRGAFPGPFRAVRLGLLERLPGGVQRLSRLLRLLRPQLLGLGQAVL